MLLEFEMSEIKYDVIIIYKKKNPYILIQQLSQRGIVYPVPQLKVTDWWPIFHILT
jgi:hypothetical protein